MSGVSKVITIPKDVPIEIGQLYEVRMIEIDGATHESDPLTTPKTVSESGSKGSTHDQKREGDTNGNMEHTESS